MSLPFFLYMVPHYGKWYIICFQSVHNNTRAEQHPNWLMDHTVWLRTSKRQYPSPFSVRAGVDLCALQTLKLSKSQEKGSLEKTHVYRDGGYAPLPSNRARVPGTDKGPTSTVTRPAVQSEPTLFRAVASLHSCIFSGFQLESLASAAQEVSLEGIGVPPTNKGATSPHIQSFSLRSFFPLTTRLHGWMGFSLLPPGTSGLQWGFSVGASPDWNIILWGTHRALRFDSPLSPRRPTLKVHVNVIS